MARKVEWYKQQVASRAGDSGYDTNYYRKFLTDDLMRSVRIVEGRLRRGAKSVPFLRGTQTITTSSDGTGGDYALNTDFAAPILLKVEGYGSTILTSSTASVTAGSGVSISVGSVSAFVVGSRYIIKSGDVQEYFTVNSIGASSIVAATLVNDYASGANILSDAGLTTTGEIELHPVEEFERIRSQDSSRWCGTIYSGSPYRLMLHPAPFDSSYTFTLYYHKRQASVQDDLSEIDIFPDDDEEYEDLVITECLRRAHKFYGKSDQAAEAANDFEQLMENKLRELNADAPDTKEYPSISNFDKWYANWEGV